jgi:two-component system, NtrC family, C4-dicarboxylate transport response regulator DctD
VVLVDDDKEYTELMITMLGTSLDCPVHPFTSPIEALRALPQIMPSVVVTDYNMPQLNGLEFIREASALAPRANFLIITGHDLSMYRDEMDRLPLLKGLLAKPFNSRKLAGEILRVWPGDGVAAPGADPSSV